jgi:hypothetical protein
MAIPPRSQNQLREDASRIIIGVVKSISHKEVRIKQGTNDVYTAKVKALREESMFTDPVEIDDEILVSYWQAGKRPKGMTGDMGQYSPLPIDEEVCMYLGDEKKGVWELLSPNGWQEVE